MRACIPPEELAADAPGVGASGVPREASFFFWSGFPPPAALPKALLGVSAVSAIGLAWCAWDGSSGVTMLICQA